LNIRRVTDRVTRVPVLWRLYRRRVRGLFEGLAPDWDTRRRPDHLAPFERALDAVRKPPRRALDLGTGTGDAARAMLARWPDAEVVGVDIAPAMLERARHKVPQASFQVADASSLPFPDGHFDLVGLANMIPFWDELTRVVAPTGAVVVGFSLGPETPIYVPPERIRAELSRRGFGGFESFAVGAGTSMLATRDDRS
jgi:ubiquinone/menaquinone biosynthesis C-methylase UbiE